MSLFVSPVFLDMKKTDVVCLYFIETLDGVVVEKPNGRYTKTLADAIRRRNDCYRPFNVVEWRGEHQAPRKGDCPDWGTGFRGGFRKVYPPEPKSGTVTELKKASGKKSRKIKWP